MATPTALPRRVVIADLGLVRVPSIRSLKRMVFDGIAEAPDGCHVEPDGSCPHGHQSWLLILGLC